MFENYDDILNVEEACEALKVGYNAMYELLNAVSLEVIGMAEYGEFQRPRWWSTYKIAPN